ncbi:ROK family protein, partial [Streptomyces mirabilis]|uniref:ROK family protein n=1 Tax=Streptomyces mirabilis TaxID=68239 RepID=UPI00368F972C
PRCHCGNRGCVEAIASDPAIGARGRGGPAPGVGAAPPPPGRAPPPRPAVGEKRSRGHRQVTADEDPSPGGACPVSAPGSPGRRSPPRR